MWFLNVDWSCDQDWRHSWTSCAGAHRGCSFIFGSWYLVDSFPALIFLFYICALYSSNLVRVLSSIILLDYSFQLCTSLMYGIQTILILVPYCYYLYCDSSNGEYEYCLEL